MNDDPSGYYAALGVDPRAEAATIAAAFRRKARVLHPDIPGSGNSEAFIRVKTAYDVLGDPHRRERYDRTARDGATTVQPVAGVGEPVPRFPRLSDLPIAVWVVFGGVLCVALIMTFVQLNRAPQSVPGPAIRPAAPPVASSRAPPSVAPALPSSGPGTHYVLPGSGDAVLWRHDAIRDAYLPAGHLDAFSPVEALRLVPQHGLVEIRLADGDSGFIDAARLAAGDRNEARRAYCAYYSGPPPGNGEVLERKATGPARLAFANRGAQPAVVKLRDAAGHTLVAVFLAPGDSAVVGDLPDIAYRPEYAVGELWSRACNAFAAGMRAQRFPFYLSPAGMSPLLIPPDLSAAPAPEDIPDTVFAQD